MSRPAHLNKSLSELKSMIDSGRIVQVSVCSPGYGNFCGIITAIDLDDMYGYPITVKSLNGEYEATFREDGYLYAVFDHSYITLIDEDQKTDGGFAQFMQLAAEEGVSVEVAMKLYNSFKQ